MVGNECKLHIKTHSSTSLTFPNKTVFRFAVFEPDVNK